MPVSVHMESVRQNQRIGVALSAVYFMKLDFRENWHDGAQEPMAGAQGHLWLHSEFKTSLGNARHYHEGVIS